MTVRGEERCSEDGLRVPEDVFSRERDALRDEIEQRGFNERLGSYVSAFDGEVLAESDAKTSRR
jgi:hypothetical protein